MIAQRMKLLRKELQMTQTDFGRAIGLSQGYFTSIESGKRHITDRTVTAICHTFHVEEKWLRFGEGEMFAKERNNVIDEIARTYRLDSMERIMVESFLSISPKQRKGIIAYFNQMITLVNLRYEEDRDECLDQNAKLYAARNGGEIDPEEMKDI